MTNPYIIVTLGPTGSGKTSMINAVISYLRLDVNYNQFLIDDLVENNDTYRKKFFLLLKILCVNVRKNSYFV